MVFVHSRDRFARICVLDCGGSGDSHAGSGQCGSCWSSLLRVRGPQHRQPYVFVRSTDSGRSAGLLLVCAEQFLPRHHRPWLPRRVDGQCLYWGSYPFTAAGGIFSSSTCAVCVSSWWRCRFQGGTSVSEQTLLAAFDQPPVSLATSCSSTQVCSQPRAARSRTSLSCCHYDTESGTDFLAGQCGSCRFSSLQVHSWHVDTGSGNLVSLATSNSSLSDITDSGLEWISPSRLRPWRVHRGELPLHVLIVMLHCVLPSWWRG